MKTKRKRRGIKMCNKLLTAKQCINRLKKATKGTNWEEDYIQWGGDTETPTEYIWNAIDPQQNISAKIICNKQTGQVSIMNDNIRTMEFLVIDDWGVPVYKCIEDGNLWKDLSQDSNNPELYSCGNEIDGDPCYPIKKDLKINFKTKYKENPNRFNYQMLDRLRCDCEYYLGNGNRNERHLYYKNEQEHIDEMKKLYNSFPKDEKPEWLTWEQILKYEKAMVC